MTTQNTSRLWVLWQLPTTPLPPNDPILSFLPPAQERLLAKGSAVFYAREESQAVRGEARAFYNRVIAEIGAFPTQNGSTIRGLSQLESGCSSWWFHSASGKDTDSWPLLDHLIWVWTIQRIQQKLGTRAMTLVGSPAEIGKIFRSVPTAKVLKPQRTLSPWLLRLRGVGSRVRYAIEMMLDVLRAKWVLRSTPLPTPVDAALMTFWDWSFAADERTHQFSDGYLKQLPGELTKREISIGRLVWIDRGTSKYRAHSRFSQWIAPLRATPQFLVLQRMIKMPDIARVFLDLRLARALSHAARSASFQRIFRHGELSLFPIFQGILSSGSWSGLIPVISLYHLAVQRGARLLRPTVALSILEHLPQARAFYSGINSANPTTISIACQHASYSSDKTYLHLDPEIEFRGAKDGVTAPHPQLFLAMGELSRRLALQCGYQEEQVIVTGSVRFAQVGRAPRERGPWRPLSGGTLKVLIAASLAVDCELDMVAAVCAATEEMSGVVLRLRKHPYSNFYKVDELRPLIGRRLELSQATLDEDLAWADVVVFTSSTVAEEAVLYGTRVWQWAPIGFDGSALAEIDGAPRFTTVAGLQKALQKLQQGGEIERYSDADRPRILRELFGPGDGAEAVRIASIVHSLLRPEEEKRAAQTATVARR